MGLKVTEQASFGGVDSRSSPINFPAERALLARNFMLTRDGHLRLRDGYTAIPMDPVVSAAVHSLISYKVVGGGRYAVFAQGTHLYLLNLATGEVTEPTVRETALAGSGHWSWASAFNRLHGTNGTDRKFFDGNTWRDIGLRALAKAETDPIVITEGVRELTTAEAAAVTVTTPAGGTFAADTLTGRLVYVAIFDTQYQEIGPATISVGSGRIKTAANDKLTLTGLPNLSAVNTNWIKLVGGTLDGGDLAWLYRDASAQLRFCTRTGSSLDVTVSLAESYLAVTGEVVMLSGTGQFDGVYVVTEHHDAIGIHHFTVQLAGARGSDVGGQGTVSRLVFAANAATTLDVLSPSQDTFYQVNRTRGLVPSTVSGEQPGYQFYACLYNPTTTHVGNRVAIAARVVPTARSNWRLSGLPDLSGTDTELAILLGRTNDGAEVPYVSTDAEEDWVFVPNGTTAAVIDAGGIDGAAELPTRNGLPPATVTAIARVGDYLYAIVSDGPWIYRTEKGVDDIDGHVGRPEQSWPGMCETFPTGDIPIGVHEFNGDAWIQTLEDLAILVDQEGNPAWQGPWQGAGIAGQESFAVSWKGLPYWISGHKQLQTMTTEGPIPISDEYESALLAQIGDAYLSEVQLVPYRDAELKLEFLAVKARDSSGNPFIVIHDFTTQDERSPYGQAVEHVYGDALGNDFHLANIRDNLSHARLWVGGSDGHIYQLLDGLTDNGLEFLADYIALPYIGPQRTGVAFLEWYGDSTAQWYIAKTLDKTADLSGFTSLRRNPNLARFGTAPTAPETVPGDEGNPHYRVPLVAPELIHAYLWLQLASHSEDAPANGMRPTFPPNMPVPTYGRVYLVSPLTDTSRGK